MKAIAIGLPCPHCGEDVIVINYHDDIILTTRCTTCRRPIQISFFRTQDPVISKALGLQPIRK